MLASVCRLFSSAAFQPVDISFLYAAACPVSRSGDMKETLAVSDLDIAATAVPLADFNLAFWYQVASLSLPSSAIRYRTQAFMISFHD